MLAPLRRTTYLPRFWTRRMGWVTRRSIRSPRSTP